MTLTPKQEKFAQGVASGMTQADAYRNSYNAEKMKPESVQVNASKLMADAKIAQRVRELKDALTKKNLWTREMSVKALVKAYQVAEGANQSTGMTAAVKELNAMHGYNEPEKIDVTSGGRPLMPQLIERVIIKPDANTNS